MEGISHQQLNGASVFTDHSSNAVTHQPKKVKPTQGKPEWQRSAIRICGYWSEQLSSKGRIYFYNCMTEVSQWQKPSEWNLPDMSRKELLKLLNERKASEEKKLKRTHSCLGPDVLASKDDLDNTPDQFKRIKYCTSDSRKSSTAQGESAFPSHSTGLTSSAQSLHYNSVNCPGLRRYESCEDGCKSAHPGGHRSHCNSSVTVHSKREQLNNLPFRNVLTDDMEISPNSSPLSDGSSPLSVANKDRSPSKAKCERASPSNSQRSQYQRSKTFSSLGWDSTKSSKSSSALCQLVDAIRASIGGLLDQSPGSSFRHPSEASPSANGTMRLPRKLLRESTSNATPQFTSPQPSNSLPTTSVTKCSSTGSNVGPGKFHNTHPIPDVSNPYETGSTLPPSNYRQEHNSCVGTASTGPVSMCKQNAHSKSESPVTVDARRIDQCSVNAAQSVGQTSPSVIFSPRTPNQIPMYSRPFSGVQSSFPGSGDGIPSNQRNGIPSAPLIASNDLRHHRSTELKNTYREFSPGDSPFSKGNQGTDEVRPGMLSPHITSRSHNSHCDQLNSDGPLKQPANDPQIHTRSQHSQLNDLVQVLKSALQQHQTPMQSLSSSTYCRNAHTTGSRVPALSPHSIEKGKSV